MGDSLDATDTIAAVATAPGQGGIGIVRLSGPDAHGIARAVCGATLPPRHARYSEFRDAAGELMDTGIALYFPAPASFTGEDVVELQGHGGPAVLELVLGCCCRLGARMAEPGEFSRRAFLNDKIDLAQAEAIADLIAATTESGVRSANRSLQGEFSRQIRILIDQVTSLRVYVEASIDFPEEEIDFIEQGQVIDRVKAIAAQLDTVIREAKQGRILRDGMKLVIAGRPNAGKSSLLNALSGEDSAIVTPIEGTTRDVLREHIQIDGMPLHIVDTAGLRESSDLVEQEGIQRAWREMATADHVLLVIDDSNRQDRSASVAALWPELRERIPSVVPVTIIHNKCDLTGQTPGVESETDSQGASAIVTLSAKTGAGLELLRQHLKNAMGYQGQSSHGFMARQRHLDALERAKASLAEGLAQLLSQGAGELLAEDLRRCHNQLGEITGDVSPDELLGKIFSSFCIGK
jgi:tRNA modification GTPase